MKQTPNTKRKPEDLVFSKIMLLFLIALLLEAALLGLHRLYGSADTVPIADGIVQAGAYVAAAAAAAGIALALFLKRKGRARYGVRLALGGVALLIVCALIAFLGPGSARELCIAVPALVLLGLIFFLYQREFLVSAVMGAVVLAFLSSYRQIRGDIFWLPFFYVVSAVLFVALAACVLLAMALRSRQGNLTVRGRTLALFPPETSYRMIFFSCGLCAAALAAALMFPVAALYALFIVAAYLFILAVYYTVILITV